MGEGGWFVPISHTNLPFNHHNDFHARQMCVFFVFIVKRYRTQTLKARDPNALGVMVLVLVYAESRHFEVTKRERRLFQSNWFDWKPKNDSSHTQTIPRCWCVCVCVCGWECAWALYLCMGVWDTPMIQREGEGGSSLGRLRAFCI